MKLNINYKFLTTGIKTCVLAILCMGNMALLSAQNINKPNKTGPLGTEVNTFSGNLYVSRNDFSVSARGMDMNMLFSYNSFNYDYNSGYGNGWSFKYGMMYKADSTGAITVTWGDGREDKYTPSGSGFTAITGNFDVFTQYQPGKYLLRSKYGLQYFFDNSAHRRLTKVTDPNSNGVTITYNDSLINAISSTAGQTLTFSYTGGRLSAITDALASPARTFNYQYDNAGNLIKVTDPLGGLTQYRYLTNGPMSGIADQNMNEADIIYFPDFSVSELIGCNSRKSFSYDTAQNKTVVTDYVPTATNQVTTYTYKRYNNQVWLTQITGNCCGFNSTNDYDENGNIVKQTDASGNIYTYTYDSRGNLLTVTDPLNHTVSYTYSITYNQVTGFTDANGNVYTVSYDSQGNPLQSSIPGNISTQAAYSAKGDLISLTDAKGNTYNFTYDTYGNPVQATGPLNATLAFAFNARGHLLSVTDPRGNTYAAQYDALDRVTAITDPLNHNTTLVYDKNSNLTAFTDVNNRVRTLAYDASDRLVTYTDPTGKKRSFVYDAMDNIIRYQDKLGNTSFFNFDNRNRITRFTDAAGNIHSYAYDANGNMTTMNYPNGNIINITYDKLDRPVSGTDASGTTGAMSYDNNGNIVSMTNATDAVVTATYNNRNLLTRIADPLGNYRTFTYDNNGSLLTATDRNNHVKQYTYDTRNRLTAFTDNNGYTIHATYDAANNVVSLTDQNNNLTTYTYDALDRTTKVTFTDGKYIDYTFDNIRNPLSSRLPDGSVINYQYDSLARLVKKTLPGNTVYNFSYDAKGRLTGASNNSGISAFGYDAINRLALENFNGHITAYSYNVPARTQTITYPDSSNITRRFDTRNRLIGLNKGNAPVATMQYNNAGQLMQTSFANGVNTTMQYNYANQLSNLSTTGVSLQNLSFTYDKEMNVTSVARPQQAEQYNYDAGNRLTSYTKGASTNTYVYDGVGNRTTANLNGLNTTYLANNINQYTSLDNSSQHINFTYDNNGNVTYDGRFYKTYDAEGRLMSDSAATGKITYQYDALGRRVQKTINGRALRYYYAGVSQIEQRDAATDTVINETVFGEAMMPVMAASVHGNYYYHPNHLNSVEAVTNAQGALAEQYRYDDFGNTNVYDANGNLISASVIGNRFGFTGQEYDAETRSYHFHFRNYNPATGSFYQKDPLGYGDGMGIYQYVHNNPGTFMDPFGLRPCPPGPPEQPKSTVDVVIDGTLYHGGNYSNVTSILTGLETTTLEATVVTTSVKVSKNVFNNPALAIPLLPVNAVNTYRSARDLANNYQTNSAGQNIDGALSVTSGSISTGLGTATATAFVHGAVTTGTVAGGTTAASSILGTLTTAAGGITAAGGLVATAGGLAIYGTVNEIWKAGTGQSLHESAGQDYFKVPLFTDFVEKSTSGEYTKFDDYTEEYIYHQNVGNLEQWLEARRRLQERKYNPRPRPTNQPCPDNPNGTQKPNPRRNPDGTPIHTEVINSKDPNEIIGPDGSGIPKWVSVKDNLPYNINYENSKSASAPAKKVRINYPIDSKQDKNTFALGSFGFNNLTFSVPPATASYYQRLNTLDSLGIYVDVTAGLDVVNNQAFWIFESIDRNTLLPVTNPLQGFLQLQDTASINKGHGFVNFTIKPFTTDVTGDTMHATAAIVFDGNDTIPTNYAKNTIDAVAPSSHMNATPTVSYTNTFPLSWGGVDDPGGSGVRSYGLYYSVNGGMYSLLANGIKRLDTTFTGSNGNTYRFFVLATDTAGNVEALKSGAEVTVLINSGVILPVTWLSFTASLRGKDGVLNWATATEINSKMYVIERSVNGRAFVQIGTLNAVVNSTVRTNYAFTDSNVVALNIPLVYYRLKQLDKNGNYTYSAIVAVPLPTVNLAPSVQVYPNPFKQALNLMLANMPATTTGDQVSLYTLDGKMVYSKTTVSHGANATITLDDMPSLTPGIYMLKLISGKQTYTFKLMKE